MAYLSMRLAREDGTDADLDEPGELLLRGPQMFSGYLNDPVRTAEAFTGDWWLRTGDLALRDSTGLYRICGRKRRCTSPAQRSCTRRRSRRHSATVRE